MATHGHCSKCKCNHPTTVPAAGKIAGALLGAMVGGSAKRDPLIALAGGLLGAGIGAVIDRTVLPRCPTCGTVLEVIAAAI